MDRGYAVGADLDLWPVKVRVNALKRIVSRRKINEVVADRRRCPRLPSWFMVWFIVAMGLFCSDAYRQVFRWLQPRRRKVLTPPRSTLCEARKRLGAAPLRRLVDAVVEWLGTPETPGSFYRGMRLTAVDGFVLDVPDTPQNERAFGRPGSGRGAGAFPQVRCVSLCEVGTHVLYRTVIKPVTRGEIPMAKALIRHLTPDMLLLWDRNFLSYDALRRVVDQQANLLVRIKKNLIFEPFEVLADGSYLSKMYASAKDRRHDKNGIVVRIIDYTIDDPARAGRGEKHRLLTTLLDAADHPAKELIVLYHERWEEENTIDELKTHQRQRPVLRSETPAGVVQEIYGLLLAHYVVRCLMFEAATRNGLDPDRVSFTGTLKILRCRLPECPKNPRRLKSWYDLLLDEIVEELTPPRRNRVNPRVIKKKMSNWAKKTAAHRNQPQPEKSFSDVIVILH